MIDNQNFYETITESERIWEETDEWSFLQLVSRWMFHRTQYTAFHRCYREVANIRTFLFKVDLNLLMAQ